MPEHAISRISSASTIESTRWQLQQRTVALLAPLLEKTPESLDFNLPHTMRKKSAIPVQHPNSIVKAYRLPLLGDVPSFEAINLSWSEVKAFESTSCIDCYLLSNSLKGNIDIARIRVLTTQRHHGTHSADVDAIICKIINNTTEKALVGPRDLVGKTPKKAFLRPWEDMDDGSRKNFEDTYEEDSDTSYTSTSTTPSTHPANAQPQRKLNSGLRSSLVSAPASPVGHSTETGKSRIGPQDLASINGQKRKRSAGTEISDNVDVESQNHQRKKLRARKQPAQVAFEVFEEPEDDPSSVRVKVTKVEATASNCCLTCLRMAHVEPYFECGKVEHGRCFNCAKKHRSTNECHFLKEASAPVVKAGRTLFNSVKVFQVMMKDKPKFATTLKYNQERFSERGGFVTFPANTPEWYKELYSNFLKFSDAERLAAKNKRAEEVKYSEKKARIQAALSPGPLNRPSQGKSQDKEFQTKFLLKLDEIAEYNSDGFSNIVAALNDSAAACVAAIDRLTAAILERA
ncbi:hypothetical protein BP5796_12708 [Coleophoma crateriformis]|uniref:Uncharacterized protein n=1 Tax=Coleophoma crateriformis TaxID=565419 RepID=A0A3D8Q6I4_9HELO|nr:hypothetical protein BP5796_12708 [Coleophoma crateriformis]